MRVRDSSGTEISGGNTGLHNMLISERMEALHMQKRQHHLVTILAL